MSNRSERALARPPVGRHRAVPVGFVVALALVALAVVAVRDLAVARGWSAGDPWVATLVGDLDGMTPGAGLLALATVVGVLGLVLVLVGLLPAPRRHVRTEGVEQLWASPAAIATTVRAAVDRVPGVQKARVSRAGRRRVVVEVATRGSETDSTAVLSGARDTATLVAGALGARRVDVRLAEEE